MWSLKLRRKDRTGSTNAGVISLHRLFIAMKLDKGEDGKGHQRLSLGLAVHHYRGGEGEEAAWGRWRGRGMGQWVGGKSLISASPGQNGRERAQAWTAGPLLITCCEALSKFLNLSENLRYLICK